MAKDILDAIYGCLVGGAIGDAMGAPVEGWYHHEIRKEHGVLDRLIPSERGNTVPKYDPAEATAGVAGAITDDTTMRHYLCLAITRKQGRILPQDYADTLLDRMNPMRVWRSDRIALEKLRLGMNPWETGKHNMPNGAAAMAIAPVGLINAGDPRQAYLDGFAIASVTQDGVDRDAAAVVSAAVAAACAPGADVDSIIAASLADASFLIKRAINKAVDAARRLGEISAFTEWFYDRMLYWHGTQQSHMPEWNEDRFFSGSSLEMVPAVFGILYLCGGDVNRSIVEGVNFGRDNDTIASVAANIAGAMQGATAIRSEWIEVVEQANRPFFEEVEGDENADFLSMSKRLRDALLARRGADRASLDRLDAILGEEQ